MIFADSQGAAVSGTGVADTKQPKQEERMIVLPVTCSSIAKAVANAGGDESEIRFFGTEAGMLVLVGQVESVSQSSGSFQFTLNDSTGRVQARYYSDMDLDSVQVGKYVTLAGQVRMSPALHLSVTAMRLVQSADEISYHMIEAATAALKLQRGKLEPSTPMPKRQPTELSSQISPPKDSAHIATAGSQSTVFTATPSTPAAATAKPKLEAAELRSAIAAFVLKRGDGSEEGVAIATICGQFLPASEMSVRTALEQLVADGELFTTIDDDHFQAL